MGGGREGRGREWRDKGGRGEKASGVSVSMSGWVGVVAVVD